MQLCNEVMTSYEHDEEEMINKANMTLRRRRRRRRRGYNSFGTPLVVPVNRRRPAYMLLVGGSDIGTIHPREDD